MVRETPTDRGSGKRSDEDGRGDGGMGQWEVQQKGGGDQGKKEAQREMEEAFGREENN